MRNQIIHIFCRIDSPLFNLQKFQKSEKGTPESTERIII